jgi:transcriptional regulator with XRE-family HTH domain
VVTGFAKWLKETRINRGMTQAQLAQSIGVTHSYISHLEHGDFLTKEGTPARPATALIDAMAEALGVSCEDARRAASYAPRDEARVTTFGKWLRQARLKSGTSQETLADNIGVTSAYISLLEGEKRLARQGSPVRLSLHLVDAIAWTLGTSCEEARLAAGFAPPETVPSSLQKLSLLDMFLRLPIPVQEDLKSQVEALYFKYYARKILGSPRAQKRETSRRLDTSGTQNQSSGEGPKPKAIRQPELNTAPKSARNVRTDKRMRVTTRRRK